MKNKQQGFSLVETLLTVLVTGLLVGAGFYIWHRNHHQPAVVNKSTKTNNNCATEQELSYECYKQANDLNTYRSTHSSISFDYPASWSLIENKSTFNYVLESFTLKGPNDFQMDFTLQNNHLNTAFSCTQNYYGTAVTLSNIKYVILPTLDNSNKENIASVNLMESGFKDDSNKTGCPLAFYPNKIDSEKGYIFSAGYKSKDSSNYTSKPASTYFSLSEVQTAEQIFESFNQ